jgi:HK97 family phage major capsid protein
MQLRNRGLAYSFADGGVAKVPAHTATASGAFVGEAGAIPVASLLLTSISLPLRKAAAITTFTKELTAGSAVNVEATLKTLIAEDVGLLIDTVLLDNVAGDSIRPAGLRNGVAGLTPSAATTSLDKITLTSRR